MPVQSDFPLATYTDGILRIEMRPPANISAWTIRAEIFSHFGSASGLIRKNVASGYGGGQSGITVTDSGRGVFNVDIFDRDTSGFDNKNYYFSVRRLDSGFLNKISEGYLQLK